MSNFGLESRIKTRPKADLAQDLGVSEAYAGRLAREKLTADFFDGRGKVQKLRADRYDEAVRLLSKGRNAKIDAIPKGEPDYNYAEERARREHYCAEQERIKLHQLEKSLLPADDVRREYTGAVRRTTGRILQVPKQLASELASESDPHQIEMLLETALRNALEQLSVEVSGVALIGGP